LPEHVGEPAAGTRSDVHLIRRADLTAAVRQHPQHDRHQRDEHTAHARTPGARLRRLLLRATAHPLSGQSTEKIVEKSHVSLLQE
jgi:hypothetical protein